MKYLTMLMLLLIPLEVYSQVDVSVFKEYNKPILEVIEAYESKIDENAKQIKAVKEKVGENSSKLDDILAKLEALDKPAPKLQSLEAHKVAEKTKPIPVKYGEPEPQPINYGSTGSQLSSNIFPQRSFGAPVVSGNYGSNGSTSLSSNSISYGSTGSANPVRTYFPPVHYSNYETRLPVAPASNVVSYGTPVRTTVSPRSTTRITRVPMKVTTTRSYAPIQRNTSVTNNPRLRSRIGSFFIPKPTSPPSAEHCPPSG